MVIKSLRTWTKLSAVAFLFAAFGCGEPAEETTTAACPPGTMTTASLDDAATPSETAAATPGCTTMTVASAEQPETSSATVPAPIETGTPIEIASTPGECLTAGGHFYAGDCHVGAITCDSNHKDDGTGNACIDKVATDWKTAATCQDHGFYWYDQTDVTETTAAGFAALVPSCQATGTAGCPSSGNIYFAKDNTGTMYAEAFNVSSIYNSYYSLDTVYSSLRCFQGLTSLNLDSNSIDSLDVRANTALTSLSVRDNTLTNLILAKNINLTTLNISGNAFTAPVDLSNKSGLYYLSMGDAGVMTPSTVKFANLPALRMLSLASSNLSAYNIAYLPHNLIYLNLNDTSISALNVAAFTALQDLSFGGNTSLAGTVDLRSNTALTTVDAVGNGAMTGLNVTGLTSLTQLRAYFSGLTSLDVTTLTALEHLDIDGNNISTIDLTNNINLQFLWLSGSSWTAVNLSGNTNLTYLNLINMNITGALNLSSFAILNTLDLSGSSWSSFTLPAFLTNLTAANMANVSGNLDLSSNINLYSVDLNSSPWSGVDLTGATLLDNVKLYNMPNFALDFTKFDAAFLALPTSDWATGIFIEGAKWAGASGTIPGWQVFTNYGSHYVFDGTNWVETFYNKYYP